jgi:CxxC motif-containing protein (DUF1111 family)
MKKQTLLLSIILAVGLMAGCQKLLPQAPPQDQLLDGPVEGLTGEQHARFLRGDVAFNDQVFTPETGLGPLFVSTSCGSCHAGDGKGHPFSTLTRFGQTDTTGNIFRHLGGPQLQHRAIAGFEPETIPAGATYTALTPPANTGLGFIEAVSDADIMAWADPNDADGDGVSGRPAWIHIPTYVIPRPGAITNNGKHIGRFGKKAPVYSLLQQTAGAYNQDMGIVSSYEPYDTYGGLELDPEVSNQTVQDVVFYLQTLKAPPLRNQNDPEVQAGGQIFGTLNCSGCHRPEMKTSASPITPLAYKTIHPYTDLLLHDMGPGLNDGYAEGGAMAQEWRTPALWGLGLSRASQGGNYFLLHDGRAHSIEAAIEAHGGEADKSRSAYMQLNASDKQKLIKFLESL